MTYKVNAKKLGILKERKDAKDFNATLVPASGSLWGAKGDMYTDLLLIDSKKTLDDGYRLNKEKVWNRLVKQAKTCHRMPVLSVEFNLKKKYEVVVIQKSNFDMFNSFKQVFGRNKAYSMYTLKKTFNISTEFWEHSMNYGENLEMMQLNFLKHGEEDLVIMGKYDFISLIEELNE